MLAGWHVRHPLLSTAFCAYSVWKTLPSGEKVDTDRSYCEGSHSFHQHRTFSTAGPYNRLIRNYHEHSLTPVPMPDILRRFRRQIRLVGLVQRLKKCCRACKNDSRNSSKSGWILVPGGPRSSDTVSWVGVGPDCNLVSECRTENAHKERALCEVRLAVFAMNGGRP